VYSTATVAANIRTALTSLPRLVIIVSPLPLKSASPPKCENRARLSRPHCDIRPRCSSASPSAFSAPCSRSRAGSFGWCPTHRPDGVIRELVNHPAPAGYKAVAAFGQSDTANEIPAGVPLDYRGGHDGGDNAQDPNVPGKDYLGGNDRGDNPQNPKPGKNYAGGGVLSGLIAAAVGGLALGLLANARRNRGGDRGPAVGQNYAKRDIANPPAGKPYGEQ